MFRLVLCQSHRISFSFTFVLWIAYVFRHFFSRSMPIEKSNNIQNTEARSDKRGPIILLRVQKRLVSNLVRRYAWSNSQTRKEYLSVHFQAVFSLRQCLVTLTRKNS